ncbi:MAG: transcriptional regulator, partial [Pseudonocardia sp.]|nr:transcriptional regulator [Pseudonocardia sp.]
ALHREIRGYPGVAEVLDSRPDPDALELLLTVTFVDPDGDLALHSALTTFGGPHDITLAELAVESFFPADAVTRGRLHALASVS